MFTVKCTNSLITLYSTCKDNVWKIAIYEKTG